MTKQPANNHTNKTIQHPGLTLLIDEAQEIVKESSRFLSGLSGVQLNWKPDPSVWSAAQCFDHLVVTDQLYIPKLQIAINEAIQKRIFSQQAIRTSLPGKLFLYSLKPGQKRKLKTFKIFYPHETFSREEIQKLFAGHQDTLIELMRKADGLDLNKVKISSPVSGLLKFRTGECFQFLLLHQQRHFSQAQNLATLAEFPKS
jgi:hypothetical protein